MKPIYFAPFLSLLILLAPASGNAAGSLLRIACEAGNKGAGVTVNGKFKGQCPLDLQVPEGVVKLKVVQAVDDLEERIYEKEIRIGDGVLMKVDVELGPGQASAKARQYIDKYWAAKFREDEQRGNSGDVKAMMETANLYVSGIKGVIEPSTEKRVFWVRKAADAGHPAAMKQLSDFYARGEAGLPKSDEQSQAWRLRAAEAGDPYAAGNLGADYLAGRYGLSKDRAKAEFWFRKEFEAHLKNANAGEPHSMAIVGERYQSGDGVEKNPGKAREWLQKSAAASRKLADAGNPAGMYMLSVASIDENGNPMSDEKKQYWRELATKRSGAFHELKELRAFVQRTGSTAR